MNDGHIAYRIVLLALIIAANGFFAASEAALLSTRKSRLRQLAEDGNVGAQAALSLLANPERLLSVVQFGVTLASLGLGWAGEETIFNVLFGFLAPFATPATTGFLHAIAFAVSFAIMSYAHVVLGEVVPKNLAIEKSDRLAVIVAPVLLVFYRITEPLVYAIEKSATAISRLIGLSGEQHGGGHSAEELKYIISASRRELQDFERDTMGRVLELGDYYAREAMVPRTAIVSVSVDATLDQVLRLFLDHLYSRMPVYDGKPENIIGILHFKDLIRVWEERRTAQERHRPVRPFRLRRILRKPLVVPETKPINQLISDFRVNHTHIAIVVDEFGTISGVITLEDALEQIFGEFEDEHDEGRARPLIDLEELELEGTTSIRDLDNQYGIELPGDAGFETLAGFLLFQLGAIPAQGDAVEYGGRRFTILEMERNRIARVRIDKTV
jgi:CBS domain containing-hemolysin-like protein